MARIIHFVVTANLETGEMGYDFEETWSNYQDISNVRDADTYDFVGRDDLTKDEYLMAESCRERLESLAKVTA